MKQTVIMLAALGVLALGAAPSGNASADIDSQVATVHASTQTASLGWAVTKWIPGPTGEMMGAAVAVSSAFRGWRVGSQVGGLFAGIVGVAVGGALGGF